MLAARAPRRSVRPAPAGHHFMCRSGNPPMRVAAAAAVHATPAKTQYPEQALAPYGKIVFAITHGGIKHVTARPSAAPQARPRVANATPDVIEVAAPNVVSIAAPRVLAPGTPYVVASYAPGGDIHVIAADRSVVGVYAVWGIHRVAHRVEMLHCIAEGIHCLLELVHLRRKARLIGRAVYRHRPLLLHLLHLLHLPLQLIFLQLDFIGAVFLDPAHHPALMPHGTGLVFAQGPAVHCPDLAVLHVHLQGNVVHLVVDDTLLVDIADIA